MFIDCFRLISIHENGTDNQRSTKSKLESQLEIKKINRRNARNNNRQGRCKAFQNIVRVFHHQRNKQSSTGLQNHEVNDKPIVTKEEPIFADDSSVVDKTSDESKRQREETQLHVSYPDGDV